MANQKNGKNRGETPASRDGFYFDDDLDSVTAGLPTGDEPEEDEVPDLPPEEDEELCLPALAAGVSFIRLATPTTDDKRLPAVVKGTALTVPPKVCKATTQTGMYFAWRIVSLEGTGAVGQIAVIERVS